MSVAADGILATAMAGAVPIVRIAVAWALAALLARAAWHKARDIQVFAAVLWNYALLPRVAVKPVARGLAALEAALAVGLALAPAVAEAARIAGLGTAALMIVYAAAIGVNLARGRYDMSCGCEGGGREAPLSGWLLLRNAVYAAGAAFVAGGAAGLGGGLGDGLDGARAVVLGGGYGAALARELIWLDWFTAAMAAVSMVVLSAAIGRLRTLHAAGVGPAMLSARGVSSEGSP